MNYLRKKYERLAPELPFESTVNYLQAQETQAQTGKTSDSIITDKQEQRQCFHPNQFEESSKESGEKDLHANAAMAKVQFICTDTVS